MSGSSAACIEPVRDSAVLVNFEKGNPPIENVPKDAYLWLASVSLAKDLKDNIVTLEMMSEDFKSREAGEIVRIQGGLPLHYKHTRHILNCCVPCNIFNLSCRVGIAGFLAPTGKRALPISSAVCKAMQGFNSMYVAFKQTICDLLAKTSKTAEAPAETTGERDLLSVQLCRVFNTLFWHGLHFSGCGAPIVPLSSIQSLCR